jgi:intraflagellar transport protein 52
MYVVNSRNISFVYPFGATINVQKPAIPILSSGATSYPFNRPIGACYVTPNGKGKLVVIGSVQLFSDQYIEKEENGKLFDVILHLLTQDSFILNQIDSNEPDVADYHQLPDTAVLAETVRSCLQESEDLPKDFRNLFDFGLFKFDTTFMSHAIGLYDVHFCFC